MKLEAPITTTKIANILKVSGDNRLSYLCGNSHGRINKWNIFKPVRSNNQTRPLRRDEMNYISFGLDIPKTYTSDQLATLYMLVFGGNPNYSNWAYLPPRGGGHEEYYRMGDFIGYADTAAPFCTTGSVVGSKTTVNYMNQTSITVGVDWNVTDYANSISFGDLFPTGDYYFCVDVHRSTVASDPVGKLRASKPLNKEVPTHDQVMVTYNIQPADLGLDLYFIYGIKRYITPESGAASETILLPRVDNNNDCVKIFSIVNYFDRTISVTHYATSGIGPWKPENTAPNPIPTRNSTLYLGFTIDQKEIPFTLYSNNKGKNLMRAVVTSYSGVNKRVVGQLLTSDFKWIDYLTVPAGTGKTLFYMQFASALHVGRQGHISFEISVDSGSTWTIASSTGITFNYTP